MSSAQDRTSTPNPTPGDDVATPEVEQRRRHVDRVLGVLDRVMPVARGVRFAVTALAVASAGAVLVFVVAKAVARTPGDLFGWLLLAVVTGLFLIPPLVLLGARFLISGIVGLPDRLRVEPGLRRDQLQQLGDLAAGRAGTPAAGGGPLRRAWEAGKLVVGARTDLLGYTALLRLASLSYLVSTLVAAGFAVLEVVLLYPVGLVLLALG
jgi:hypothetical protein